jgi:NAD(P)H dehydrogenase (quinone)
MEILERMASSVSTLLEGTTHSRGVQVLVVVYSRFGVLRRLAEAVVEGVTAVAGAEPHIIEIPDEPVDELRPGESQGERNQRRTVVLQRLAAADAVIVGTPAYFGSMASAVKRFFEDVLTGDTPPPVDRSRPWHLGVLHDKIGAAFTASATPHGGNEMALHSVLTLLMHTGAIIVTPGQEQPPLENQLAPYGATAISGPSGDRMPTPEELQGAQALGTRVARIAVWLRSGRHALANG